MNEPVLSVIVPALNEAENIAGTLLPLQEERGRSLEIILADGGSTDDTPALARPWINEFTSAPPGRASQMNAGAELAQGRYLFFLHADTQITPEALSELLAHCATGKAQWGFFRVRLAASRWRYRVIESFMNYRSQLTRVATGDQGLFVSKITFQKIGGFSTIPLMEDIEISKRLRKIAEPAVLKKSISTSARRWEQYGVFRTVLLMWYLRLAYFCGVSPETLHRYYYKPTKLRG